MNRIMIAVCIVVALVMGWTTFAEEELAKGFVHPPPSARPHT